MLNLGGLFFTLDADTRGLQTAQRRVETFATQVRSAFRGVGNGTVSPQFANQLARQERQVVASMERIKRLQNTVATAGFKGEMFANARQELERLTHQYEVFTRKMASGTPVNALDFGRRMQHMRSQIDDSTRSISNMQKELRASQTAWGNATGLLHSLGSAALVVQGHFGGFSTRLFFFANLVKESGFAIATVTSALAGMASGLGLIGAAALGAGKQLQQINMALTAVTGNSAVTATQLVYIKDVANQAGLVFEDVAKGWTRFLASAQGNIGLQQAQDSFRGVSLAASKMQLSVDDTQGVFRALDQMMSKGTVQAEELRGQLGDRLPGAFKIAAAAMGVTTAELGKMMKKGQVASAEFIPKFAKQMETMFHIDTSKNVNTLQASLNRLSNEWTYFGQNLNQAVNATGIAGRAVDLLGKALNGVSASLPAILSGLAGLTAAFVGLAASMAISAVVGLVVNMWNAVAVYNVATRSVMLFATAINVANAAMTRFPAAKLIGLLLNIIVTIGSAVVGYKMMENAINDNNAALQDTRGFEAYIDGQTRMGFAVRKTTMEMLAQLAAQAATIAGRVAENEPKLRRQTAQYTALAGTGNSGGRRRPGLAGAAVSQMRSDLLESAGQMSDDAKALSTLQGLLGKFKKGLALPEMPMTSGGSASGPAGPKGKTPKEKLSETAKAYQRLVDDIAKSATHAKTMQEEIQYILGGGNQEGLVAFKGLEDARNALHDFSTTTPEGIDAFKKVQQALTKAGITVKRTGDIFADTSIALGEFFTQAELLEDAVRVWVQLSEAMRQTADAVADVQTASNGFASSNIWGSYIGDETQKAIDRGRAVEEYRRSLILLGQDQGTVNIQTQKYLELLRSLDTAKEVYDKVKERADATKAAMHSMVSDFSNGLKDVVTGVKSVGDALRDLAMSIVNNMWERFVTMPLNNLLDNIGKKKAKKATSGIDEIAAGLPNAANDNATKVAQLGIASTTATTALNGFNSAVVQATTALANMAGGASTGGGGSGLLGKILNVGVSLIGKGISKDAISNAPGRALGGSMSAGSLYQINEPGVSGEYFIPSVNGYMSRGGNGSGGTGAVTIDARTTIDARGADATAVARLREEMAVRDSQLRKELPFLIDGRVRDSSGRRRYG